METLQQILGALNFHLPAFIMQVALFVIFHFSMRAIVYDRMLDVRNRRDGQIDGRLAQAEQMAGNARRLKEEYEEKMRSLRHELHEVLAQEMAAAEKAAGSQTDQARQQADQIHAEVRAQVESERAKAEAEMDARATRLGQAMARRVLENNLTPAGASRILSKIGS